MDGDASPSEGSASGFAFGGSYQESPPVSFPVRDQVNQPSGSGGYPGSPYGWGFGPPMPYPGRAPEYYGRDSSNQRIGGGTVNSERTSYSRGCAACCCICVLNTVWVFVAIAIIFGVYASETLQLGPNSSLLINPNHLFVDSIKVVELDAIEGSVLYGFYKNPPLDVVVNWSEAHNITLPGSTHKDWIYRLNKGSQITVSFTFSSPSSPPLVLVIARGEDDLTKWLENPSDSSTTFSWHHIHENGSIQMAVSKPSAYYIAVGNLNNITAEVQLHTRIKAFLYNTTEAYYNCTPLEGSCRFQLPFPGGNAAVLTSPGRKSDMADGDWSFRLSYGPRWTTYLVVLGATTVSVLVISYIMNYSRSTEPERREDEPVPERKPLLSHKDIGRFGRKSSYGSISRRDEYAWTRVLRGEKWVKDEESAGVLGGGRQVKDEESAGVSRGGRQVKDEESAGVLPGGKQVKDEENSERNLCAICEENMIDCFFIPCGHSMACSQCATRVVEAFGNCPVCREPVVKVRKIYTA